MVTFHRFLGQFSSLDDPSMGLLVIPLNGESFHRFLGQFSSLDDPSMGLLVIPLNGDFPSFLGTVF